MPSERQLFRGSENSHAHTLLTLAFSVLIRNYERRFRKVSFPRQCLHVGIRKRARIVKNGKRIAFEQVLGKDIQHGIFQLAGHASMLFAFREDLTPLCRRRNLGIAAVEQNCFHAGARCRQRSKDFHDAHFLQLDAHLLLWLLLLLLRPLLG